MITENLSTLKIHKLTQAQYNRELEAGNIDENALYLTPDEASDLGIYATKEELDTKADSIHDHDSLYYKEYEIDEMLSYKADESHSHGISDVTNLQSSLDSKTSQLYVDEQVNAVKESLESHTDNSDIHVTSENKAQLDEAHSHATSDHAPSDAEKNTIVGIKRNGEDLTIDADRKVNITVPTIASDIGAASSTHDHNDQYDSKGSAGTVQDALDAHTSNSDIHFTATERTKLSGIEAGAQANTITGVKGNSESSYRTGNVNITKSNIGLGNVDNTSDTNKPVSTAQQAAIDGVLSEAKAYTDGKISGMATTTVVDNKISTHNSSTSAHSDIRGLISDLATKVNNFLDVDDATTDQLSEVLELINNNKGTLDSITSGKVNVSDIIDNLTTSSATKVLSAKQGVALKSLIDTLQAEVDSKIESVSLASGTNKGTLKLTVDGNSTDNIAVKGLGSAAYTASSDYASKTEFDSHVADTTKHITSTERTNWNTAKTHANSSHAPSNAEKNQNAFSNIAVSGQTTVAADTTTDTVTFVGSNVTITTDAINDKVTFSVADGSKTTKGLLQLTDSVSNTSTTTAATPNAVKTAYDLANTAKTNAATAQTKADSAYSLAESKVDSLSDLGITATAKELNYVDGVTSNVQTQLDDKLSKTATAFGNMNNKTIADLQTALDSWLATHGNTVNASANFVASRAWISAWNSGDTSSVLEDGGRWTVTVIAHYNNKSYTQLMCSSYYDGEIVYIHRNGGTWGIVHKASFKDDLDSKQATITGAATTITGSNLTASRALISNSSGKVAVSDVTSTELGYLDGVTSGIQAQIDSKANSDHAHNYAGSSEAGGAATSANKLNTNAGSATKPVYFDGGIPVACTNTLGKSVPSDAVFTDGKVSQAPTSAGTTDANYRLLLSGSADDTSHTEGARKDPNLYFNPSTGMLTVPIVKLGGATISYDTTEKAIVFNFS